MRTDATISAVTLIRRLGAIGSLWIVLVATTASVASADEPAPQEPAGCRTVALLGLPCALGLPPVPVITLPLEPGGTELLPTQLTHPLDEVLSTVEQLPGEVAAVTEALPAEDVLSLTEPLPVNTLVQPVTALVTATPPNPQGGDRQDPPAPAVEGANPEPAITMPASSTITADGSVEGTRQSATARTFRGVGRTSPAATTVSGQPSAVGVSTGGAHPRPALSLPIAPQTDPGIVALTLAIGGGASLAVELVRGGGGGFAGVIAFNVWLRRQLRETRMSQRQLAAFSGVDHSTISRLMSGERAPSLATATKLTKALHKLGGLPHAGDYFARLADVRELPTRRVEAALLGDEELDDEDVRALMHAYVQARARRQRLRAAAAASSESMPSEEPRPA